MNLLLAGPQSDPGLMALCGKMNDSPRFERRRIPGRQRFFKQARDAFDRRVPIPFTPDAALIGSGRVSLGATEVEAALQDGPSTKIALLGGADTLLQSLGHLPVELAKALRGEESCRRLLGRRGPLDGQTGPPRRHTGRQMKAP